MVRKSGVMRHSKIHRSCRSWVMSAGRDPAVAPAHVCCAPKATALLRRRYVAPALSLPRAQCDERIEYHPVDLQALVRSEERRVGKEVRCRVALERGRK